MSHKPKAAFYWCASCGGCEEAIVDLNEDLLKVSEQLDIVFWPAAMDFKVGHVEAMGENEIAVCFINGAVRTDEQAHMAKLLREKAAVVVAFGSCAHMGGIPGLANLVSKSAIMRTSFFESPTVSNEKRTFPSENHPGQKEAPLPGFWEQAHSLDQLISVDYYVPGCPPTPNIIKEAVEVLLSGSPPPKGTVLAPVKALCETCPKERSDDGTVKVRQFVRPHQVVADPSKCFLEQGIVCCGPATRTGCGELCVRGNMPCTGCFGPTPGVKDQGAALLSALAAYMDAGDEEQAAALAKTLADLPGTLYRYSVPASTLFKNLSPKERQ